VSSPSLAKVPIEKIRIPEVRASSKFTEEQEAFFKATIDKVGVISPIVLRRLEDGFFELQAGKSRLEELKARGNTEVEAKIIDTDEKTGLIIHLAENLARGSTDPISEAKVIKKLISLGSNEEEVAKILGRSKEWVELRLALLQLPEKYQGDLTIGKLKVGHVEEILRLPNPIEIEAALSTARDLDWPVVTLRNYVDNRLTDLARTQAQNPNGQPVTPPPPAAMAEMARTRQCLCCGQMRLVTQIRLPTMCDSCYELLRYVTSQLGKPEDAIQTVYKAVDFYMRYQEWQRRQTQPGIPPPPPPTSQLPT